MSRSILSASILIGFLFFVSNFAVAQPTPTPCPIPPVPNVTATAGPGFHEITVTATVPSAGYTTILISSDGGNNFEYGFQLTTTTNTRVFNNLDTNKTYYFQAITWNTCESSSPGTAQATTFDIDPPTLSLDNSVHQRIAITSNLPIGADSTTILKSTSPFDANCTNAEIAILNFTNPAYPMPIFDPVDTNKLYYYCAISGSGTRIRATTSSITSRDIEAPTLSAELLNTQAIKLTATLPTGADATDVFRSTVPFNSTCSNGNFYVGRVTFNSQFPIIDTYFTPNQTYYYCAIAYSGTRQKTSNIEKIAVFVDVNAGESCPVLGEPVNVTNGNMWLKQNDYSLSGGVGESLNLTRTYNSITQSAGLFGNGWTSELSESISVKDSFVVAWILPNGRGVYFGRNSVTAPFAPIIPGTYENLVQNGDNTYTVTFKDGRIHRFGANGKILYKEDRNGNQIIFNYEPNGDLANITDAFGRTVYVDITNGLITQITDAYGLVATYEYFAGTSKLKTVTYPDGSKYQFEYGVFGGKEVLTSVKDALNNILETHEYDTSAMATTSEKHGGVEKYTLNYSQIYSATPYTTVTDALGRVTKYYFDRSRKRHVVTKIEGNCNCGGSSETTLYEYDANLNKTKKTDGNGNVMTMTYNTNGDMLTETDPTGTKTYTYNTYGQVLTATDQMGGVTTVVYDTNGRPTTLTDALSHSTGFSYTPKGQIFTVTDARGNVTTYTWTNANLTKIKDANLKETTFGYDTRSRLTSTTNALNYTTSYEYDLNNRLKKVTHPDNKFEEFGYDLAGRRETVKDARGYITTFGYDNAYRLTSVTDALSHVTGFGYDLMSNRTSVTDAEGKITNTEYDDFNRVKKVIYPEITVGGIRLNEQFQYDLVGNLKKRIDTAGRETTFDYDTANRLYKTTDALGNDTIFTYNARSQRTKVTDALNQEYEFSFDALGRQLSQTRAGLSMSYEYDSVGNRTKRIDYEGRETFYYYDNLNRLDDFSYFPPGTITVGDWGVDYSYDDLSRLTDATNHLGKVSFQYDNRNRVTQTKDVHNQILNFLYDENGNRSQLKLNNVVHTDYVYDAVNRLTTLTDDANQNFTFGYDAANKMTSKTLPNGIVTSYNYDGMNRLKELKHQQGSTVLADNNYSYNPANQISGIAELSNTKTFGYDNVDRLTSMTSPTLTNENYSFDEVGNRTSSHLSSYYGYEANNRLREAETHPKINYDNNGNPTEIDRSDSSTSFTWDYENRVAAANNGDEITFEYDALGRRVKRTKGTDVTKFTYDGQDVVMDNDNGIITKYQNGLGIDNKLKLKTGTVSKYFLQDHLGSTTALTNSSGSVVESATYDSFGNATGNLSTRYGYTGREFDADLGLQYSRARWYDATLGRFISEDPIGFVGSPNYNLYSYTLNNPMNYVDSSGESPTLITGAAGAIIGGTIGAALAYANGGDAEDIAKAAAVGAVAGGVAGLTLGLAGPAIAGSLGGGIIGNAVAGGVASGIGNLAGQGFSIALGWKCEFRADELGLSVLTGAITGGFAFRLSNAPNQQITSWASKGGTPDLNPGRWVMTGGGGFRNWLFSGRPAKAPFSNSITGSVPGSQLANPTGLEAWKFVLGQRILR